MSPLAPRPSLDPAADPGAADCWACGAEPDRLAGAPVGGLRRCGSCGLVFRPVSHADVAGLYSEHYFEGYAGGPYLRDARLRAHEANVRLAWMERCGIRPPGRLLEIGAAAGFFLAAAAQAGWDPEGIEPAGALAAHARQVHSVDVRAGFAEHYEPVAGTIDVVAMWHVLEHIPDPLAPLRRLAAGLRGSGRLVLEVPNAGSLMARRRGWAWAPWEFDVHVAHYTPRSLAALLGRAGLEVERSETVPFLTYVRGPHRRLPRHAVLAWRQRRVVRAPHPSAHELLRACCCTRRTGP